MRVCVMGASSFAGSAMVESLRDRGISTLAMVRPGRDIPGVTGTGPPLVSDLKVVERDLLTASGDQFLEDMRDFGVSHVIDFAGQGMVEPSWGDPSLWYQTNLVAKVSLLRELTRLGSLDRYIRISTPEVFGHNDSVMDESHRYNPTTPYAVSHAALEMHLQAMGRRHDFPFVIGRFANFYGPWQQLYRLIPRLFLSIALGERFPLQGDGSSQRAFLYRSDLVDAVTALLNHAETQQAYHFSPREVYTIWEVITRGCEISGVESSQVVVHTSDRPSKDGRYLMESAKARKNLGWQDSVTLNDGLWQTREWVLQNLDQLANTEREFRLRP